MPARVPVIVPIMAKPSIVCLSLHIYVYGWQDLFTCSPHRSVTGSTTSHYLRRYHPSIYPSIHTQITSLIWLDSCCDTRNRKRTKDTQSVDPENCRSQHHLICMKLGNFQRFAYSLSINQYLKESGKGGGLWKWLALPNCLMNAELESVELGGRTFTKIYA